MQSERLYKLKDLLASKSSQSLQDLQQRLEVSPATVKRMIQALRDRFDMPIVYDRHLGGYRLDANDPARQSGPGTKTAELPGLWFSPDEALALLTVQQLLSELEPGFLEPKLRPLRQKLNRMLESAGHSLDAVQQRIRVLPAGKRRINQADFQVVAKATLEKKRLRIVHLNRDRAEELLREVSPQQLVYYRDNWYLDAWCHVRNGLRSFALDAIRQCEPLDTPALEVPHEEIKATLAAGYGIFGGQVTQVARLRFTPRRAQWVSHEQWHPQQKAWFEPDGSYLLEVPYSDERELVGDILRFGDAVEVLGPANLRKKIQLSALAMAQRYV